MHVSLWALGVQPTEAHGGAGRAFVPLTTASQQGLEEAGPLRAPVMAEPVHRPPPVLAIVHSKMGPFFPVSGSDVIIEVTLNLWAWDSFLALLVDLQGLQTPGSPLTFISKQNGHPHAMNSRT